jgi:putative Mg2+ transporter-C (MgtC) family protein
VLTPAEIDILVRALVAGVLGYLVGLEREWAGQQAGSRTFSLVAMGSALFTALGFEVFSPGSTEGASRIAQNVLTGVGFLGGGMILRDRRGVRGLTTAAGIWAIAAVGMASGSGRFAVAALAAAIIFVTFALSRIIRLRRRLSGDAATADDDD